MMVIRQRGRRINLITVLAIIFIVLKLTGNISWSWVWVLGPIWMPVALLAAFSIISMLLGFVLVLVVTILENR